MEPLDSDQLRIPGLAGCWEDTQASCTVQGSVCAAMHPSSGPLGQQDRLQKTLHEVLSVSGDDPGIDKMVPDF